MYTAPERLKKHSDDKRGASQFFVSTDRVEYIRTSQRFDATDSVFERALVLASPYDRRLFS